MHVDRKHAHDLSQRRWQTLWLLSVTFCEFGCASFASTLRSEHVAQREGAFFGRIRVYNGARDVTDDCNVDFVDRHGNDKTDVDLDKTGWVFSSVEKGPTILDSVTCNIGWRAGRALRGIWFNVLGDGALAYFGDVRIELGSDGPRLRTVDQLVFLPQVDSVGRIERFDISTIQREVNDGDFNDQVGNSWVQDNYDAAVTEFDVRFARTNGRARRQAEGRPYRAFLGAKPPRATPVGYGSGRFQAGAASAVPAPSHAHMAAALGLREGEGRGRLGYRGPERPNTQLSAQSADAEVTPARKRLKVRAKPLAALWMPESAFAFHLGGGGIVLKRRVRARDGIQAPTGFELGLRGSMLRYVFGELRFGTLSARDQVASVETACPLDGSESCRTNRFKATGLMGSMKLGPQLNLFVPLGVGALKLAVRGGIGARGWLWERSADHGSDVSCGDCAVLPLPSGGGAYVSPDLDLAYAFGTQTNAYALGVLLTYEQYFAGDAARGLWLSASFEALW